MNCSLRPQEVNAFSPLRPVGPPVGRPRAVRPKSRPKPRPPTWPEGRWTIIDPIEDGPPAPELAYEPSLAERAEWSGYTAGYAGIEGEPSGLGTEETRAFRLGRLRGELAADREAIMRGWNLPDDSPREPHYIEVVEALGIHVARCR